MEERCIIDTDEKWVEILLSSVIIRNSNLHLGAVIMTTFTVVWMYNHL